MDGSRGQARRNQRSTEAQSYRHLYKLKAWAAYDKCGNLVGGLKLRAHVRDLYTCQMCGRLHFSHKTLTADHRTRHRGDPTLFWDISNVQSLCTSPCHTKHKQREERGRPRITFDADGFPVW